MDNKTKAMVGFLIFLIAVTIIFNIWWHSNAPYCCTHMCGQTTSAGECWGSGLTPILITFDILYLALIIKYNLDKD